MRCSAAPAASARARRSSWSLVGFVARSPIRSRTVSSKIGSSTILRGRHLLCEAGHEYRVEAHAARVTSIGATKTLP